MESNGTTASGQGGVSLRGVTKRFGNFVAVDDLDLDLESGEFFTLLGPSGCGKTTTLRMIAGFETPDEGSVLIDDTDVASMPPHKRPTNTVFQSYALFPHMSVRDNVAYGLKRKGRRQGGDRPARPGRARARRPLGRGQPHAATSSRAASSSASPWPGRVVNLPKVLLLDEPLGALDLKLRKSLQVELKRIQKEIGITFVYVTHDQEEALTMSDRIAVMNRGIVEQVAGPEEVYERPTTTFVAGFIGVSNLMPGTVRSLDGDRASVELEAGRHRPGRAQRPRHRRALPRGRAARRSSSSSTAGNGSAPDTATQQSVDGVVASSVYLGTATQLVVELKGGSRMTVLVPNASETAAPGASRGWRRRPSGLEPDHIHLVRESGSERATADHEALGKQPTGGQRLDGHRRPPPEAQRPSLARRSGCGRGTRRFARAIRLQRPRRRRSRRTDPDGEGARASRPATSRSRSGPRTSTRQTIPDFEKKTGLSVDYIEDVNDNNEIFSKLQPTLQNGDPSGRSMIVVTDWMAKKMYDLGYLQNFDKNAIPVVNKNLIPACSTPTSTRSASTRPPGRAA